MSRRDAITGTLGLLGATAAAALVPSRALGAENDLVQVSVLATASGAGPVFNGLNTGTGPGMIIEAKVHDAIRAYGNGAARSSLYASHSGDGWGVYAEGMRAGVHGFSGQGPGVSAQSTAAGKAGVEANNAHPDGFGVMASGGRVGVVGGALTASGTGVYAENLKGGFGLRVVGKTSLSRSGVSTTVVGQSSRTVGVPSGLTTLSKFLVTMQGNPGPGVFVTHAARSSATQFRVYFNKRCTAAVKFAWMVLDE